jgi:hypothetical protein
MTVKNTLAQTTPNDSAAQQKPANNAVKLFYSSLGKQSPLYNGREYLPADPSIKGNAFFLDVNTFTSGNISYDGLFFTGVPMIYDIHNDQVVVLLYNKFSKLVLLGKLLKDFDFLNHHFINIKADSISDNSVVSAGYYDEIYNGKTKVLVKRVKNIQTTSSAETYFETKRDIFIKKNNIYYSTSSQGSLLDALKDKKKELQQYISANKIKFRKDPEDAMIRIVSYYDHLVN